MRREFPCECHDTDAEHEAWFAAESLYWGKHFGTLDKDGNPTGRELAGNYVEDQETGEFRKVNPYAKESER